MPECDVCDRARQARFDFEEGLTGTAVFSHAAWTLLGEMVTEVERLRANQRVEELEPWLGKCKGGQ